MLKFISSLWAITMDLFGEQILTHKRVFAVIFLLGIYINYVDPTKPLPDNTVLGSKTDGTGVVKEHVIGVVTGSAGATGGYVNDGIITGVIGVFTTAGGGVGYDNGRYVNDGNGGYFYVCKRALDCRSSDPSEVNKKIGNTPNTNIISSSGGTASIINESIVVDPGMCTLNFNFISGASPDSSEVKLSDYDFPSIENFTKVRTFILNKYSIEADYISNSKSVLLTVTYNKSTNSYIKYDISGPLKNIFNPLIVGNYIYSLDLCNRRPGQIQQLLSKEDGN